MPPPAGRSWTRWDTALTGVIAIVALGVVFGRLPQLWPQFDLLVHFQVQYLVAAAIAGGALLIRRRVIPALVAGLLVLITLGRVMPWYLPDHPVATVEPTSLRILSSNVRWTNPDVGALRVLIEQVDPDIIVIQEASGLWKRGVAPLAARWPYSIDQTHESPAGMILMSRIPLTDTDIFETEEGRMPTLVARLGGAGGPWIVAAHPIRPGPRHGCTKRDAALAAIGDRIAGQTGSTILIGDLNTTMWSRGYDALIDRTSMRNTRQGRGIMPSWWRLLPWLTDIPIDHCLLRGPINATSFTLHDLPGSDHRTMVVDLAVGLPPHDNRNR